MKRIICVMLTLIMLVSLVPAAALTADAATLATSGSAITVLKNMLTFKKDCYRIDGTNEYRIGYGSICTESHKDGAAPHQMNQATADNLLREELKKIDTKVNGFASSNSLNLDQGEFDALTVFSYLTGITWMSGNGNIKTAVLNDAGSSELLNAFTAALGNPDRAKILVNMYMNGVYSNSVPNSYSQVTYHANGGTMAVTDQGYKLTKVNEEKYTLYFDASDSVSHPVKPTFGGNEFLGWYFMDGKGAATSRSEELDDSCKDQHLIAVWQRNDTTPDNAANNNQAPSVNYTVYRDDLATASLYKKPTTSEKRDESLGSLKIDEVLIVREYMAEDGYRWGLVDKSIKGLPGGNNWVRLGYVSDDYDDSSDSNGSVDSGTPGSDRIGVYVTNSYVNVRKEPSIYAALAKTLNQNTRVYISRTETANGFLWGKTYESRSADTPIGWIALMYTDYNTAKNQQSSGSSSTPTPSNVVIAKATITYNGYVNMRDGAGTDNKIVGSLAKNEIVSVYEIKTVNGHQWGRTSGGWFCMTYASVEMLKGDSDISNSGSEAYTFTGKAVENLKVYKDTTTNSNLVDAKNAPKSGDEVDIITLKVRNGETWARVGWTYTDEDDDDVTEYGWVKVGAQGEFDQNTIKLDTVSYTIVADSVNVRADAGSGSALVTKLDKGYEFDIQGVKVVGEEIWGKTSLTNLNGGTEVKSGWVNLASKYAVRSDMVDEDNNSSSNNSESSGDKKFATIVGADRVNVRDDSKITAKFVGQLARGTVVEIIKERDGWYKVDADVDNNPNTSSWVYGDYVEVSYQSSNITNAPSSHGTGVVANTYAGVNVRTGAGTAYAIVGTKLLPGTQVKILETKYVGATKWGRIGDNKWVCMDYISMLTEVVDQPEQPKPEAPNGGEWVGSYDEVDRTTTTAVYTGHAYVDGVKVWKNTEHHEDEENSYMVRVLAKGDPVTVYELIAVTEKFEITDNEDGSTKEETVTTYWARINDGYIMAPEKNIDLDALDEKTHTLTGAETLNVRPGDSSGEWVNVSGTPLGKLNKGDKVQVTKLSIVQDKVWGRIEFSKDNDAYVQDGWIRLDYMSEGALYEEPEETKPETPNTPEPPANNNNNSTGDTGKTDGSYRYDGKVINTTELKVRERATTNSAEVIKLKSGAKVYIYETTIADGMAWGRCDAGWVYLYYIDLTPRDSTYVDARVVYNPGTPIYSDAARTEKVGTYASMATIDIYEIVGNMARTELGWVNTGDLL